MTKKSNFIDLVLDEPLIRLLIEASNPDELREELIRKNPESSDSIRYAFKFIQANLSNKKDEAGVSLFTYYLFAKDPLTQFAQSNIVSGNEAVIVLSDGTKYDFCLT